MPVQTRAAVGDVIGKLLEDASFGNASPIESPVTLRRSKRDTASGSWCDVPALHFMAISDSGNRSAHLERLGSKSRLRDSPRNAEQSVIKANLLHANKGRTWTTAHKTAMYSHPGWRMRQHAPSHREHTLELQLPLFHWPLWATRMGCARKGNLKTEIM